MDFSRVEQVAAALAVVALALIALWLIRLASRGRLIRCPETNGVAFVEVGERQATDTPAPAAVRQCDLWPEKQGCAQGCLVRYSQTVPGLRVRLEALRPFPRP